MNDVAFKTLSAEDLIGDLLEEQQSLTAVDRFSQRHESAAEPLQVERVAWVIPVMLRARYRFRDRHAQWCEGRHWVPARSALGIRLTSDPSQLAVVHDRSHPAHGRLVVPPDFVPMAGAPTEPQAARRA